MGAKLKAKINNEWVEVGGSGEEIPVTSSLLKGDGSGGITSATAGTDYQAPLVSGTNIKTINGQNLLGSGDLTVSGSSALKYGDSIDKPYDFQNKTIKFYGDSITAGVKSGTYDASDKGYAQLFCDKVGATMSNSAVSGSTTASISQTNSSVYSVINSAETITADYIIIGTGTNDYYYQVTMGNFDSITVSEFNGALNQICTMLKTKAPDVPVIFITPINKPFQNTYTTKIYSLDDYRNAIFEIATSHGFSVVDGSSLGFPATSGSYATKMIADGIHPTADGHKMYARSLAGKLL